MNELRQELKKEIIQHLNLQGTKPEDITDDMPLFGEGLGLDSIDALELVVLIEEHFGIAIPDEEVGKSAFASIAALADYISAEQARAG